MFDLIKKTGLLLRCRVGIMLPVFEASVEGSDRKQKLPLSIYFLLFSDDKQPINVKPENRLLYVT